MIIQLNTDKNISGNEKREGYLNQLINEELARFSDQITRIEIHLSDENAGKTGANDKRCKMEARLSGKQPITVSSDADSVNDAVNVALGKLKTAIARELKLD